MNPLVDHASFARTVTIVAMVGLLCPPAFSAGAPAPAASSPTNSATAARPGPLSPSEAAKSFRVADDLVWEQVLSEPEITQPVFLTFDERHRMWVVEYRQYPHPAGVNIVSRDSVWRAVYDRVSPPPPRHFRGADRITIHEDSDGDGTFERHKTFVDGLNIATSVAFGRGGVFVLNPPYLLYYPDRDRDDRPDGDPELLLSGFGLEDTHSVANSLRWGPDGWLYGCQGSTVTANILVHGSDGKPLDPKPHYSQGQNIWRYHPWKRRYEVFAEGGGNAFGLEFDVDGRAFSGHNGGNTRGFHYQQGAYLQKGFDKHGPLSNPHAFGYFPPMAHPDVDRFTHTFVIYMGDGLPAPYLGRLVGVEPLQGRIVLSEIVPDGSTFRTRDLSHPVTSNDPWFRPVDIKLGPEGALYVADWYDRQVNHFRNHEGQMDASNGRIYRLRAKSNGSNANNARALTRGVPPDLGKATAAELLGMLNEPNQSIRQLAHRLLADQGAAAGAKLRDTLQSLLAKDPAPQAGRSVASHEWVWAAFVLGVFDDGFAATQLSHRDAQVRLWTIRLLGDDKKVSPGMAMRLAQLAAAEPELEVRAQLACTAARLNSADALPILRSLVQHDGDAKDARQPLLLWWALEKMISQDRASILSWWQDRELWRAPLVRQHLIARMARRFAAAGTQADWAACARLFELSPERQTSERLMTGFEEAFSDRPLPVLPGELTTAMSRAGATSPWLAARAGDSAALATAMQVVADAKSPLGKRLQLIPVFAERRHEAALPVLLGVLHRDGAETARTAAATALGAFDDARSAEGLVAQLIAGPRTLRPTVLAVLTSRSSFGEALLNAVDSGRLPKDLVPPDAQRRLQKLRSPAVKEALARHWPGRREPTPAQLETEVQRVLGLLGASTGDPYAGRKLFRDSCAGCHRLFNLGADLAPNLTPYPRHDLESMVLNIVHPNAEIREGYQGYIVETKDGRNLNGFLLEQDERRVVLRGLDGQSLPLVRAELESLEPMPGSLMPEGLLSGQGDQQIRDLFAYLRSTQPLHDAKD